MIQVPISSHVQTRKNIKPTSLPSDERTLILGSTASPQPKSGQ